MDKRFAIFDMDGTLVDSMGYWQSLEREFLISKGVTENLEDILERTKPLTFPEAAALVGVNVSSLLSGIARRVPRVYFEKGEEVMFTDYLF